MFREALLAQVGETVQIVTAVKIITGTLLAVTNDAAIVQVPSIPSYGPAEEVTVRLPLISYVRLF